MTAFLRSRLTPPPFKYLKPRDEHDLWYPSLQYCLVSDNIAFPSRPNAKADADKFAEEDKKKAELVESRNKLEHLIYQMENTLTENKDKIPEEEKTKVEKMLAELRELKGKEDATKEEIEKAIEEAQKELQELMQKFQASTENKWGKPESEMDNKEWEDKKDEVEWEVIDADK